MKVQLMEVPREGELEGDLNVIQFEDVAVERESSVFKDYFIDVEINPSNSGPYLSARFKRDEFYRLIKAFFG